jgi:hypothetical protein
VTVDRTGVAPGAVSQGRRERAGSAVIGQTEPSVLRTRGFSFFDHRGEASELRPWDK